MLSADDYDAELAERYGWINRALPADALGDFVSSLAHRIARFPAAGHAVVKDRVDAIALAPVEDFRQGSDLFGEGVRAPEAQRGIAAAMKHGLQTRDAALTLARTLGELARPSALGGRPHELRARGAYDQARREIAAAKTQLARQRARDRGAAASRTRPRQMTLGIGR